VAVEKLGEELAAVRHPRRRLRPESKGNSSVAGEEGLALALRGAIDCWVLGGVESKSSGMEELRRR